MADFWIRSGVHLGGPLSSLLARPPTTGCRHGVQGLLCLHVLSGVGRSDEAVWTPRCRRFSDPTPACQSHPPLPNPPTLVGWPLGATELFGSFHQNHRHRGGVPGRVPLADSFPKGGRNGLSPQIDHVLDAAPNTDTLSTGARIYPGSAPKSLVFNLSVSVNN